MADEASIRIQAASTLTGGEFNTGELSGSWTVTGVDVVGGLTQNIGTIDEEVIFSAEVGSIPNFVVIQNQALDSTGAAVTKYVDLSFDTGGSFAGSAFARIPAGLSLAFFPSTPTGKTKIYAKAETGATNGVQVKKWAAEA